MNALRNLLLAGMMLAATPVMAHGDVNVQDAWIRATVPQQKATGAFMKLTAPHDRKLVKASSPLTQAVEIHEMAMADNVMKMRQVQSVDLPAGQTVELKPGGYHIMLLNLPRQVKDGETIPLTLTFSAQDGKQESVTLDVPVKPLTGGGKAADGHSHAASHEADHEHGKADHKH